MPRRSLPMVAILIVATALWVDTARGQVQLNPAEMTDRDYAVDAPALSGIKIDGDLSDWPAAIPRYPIRNILPTDGNYGQGGLEKADLSTSADLSAAFSVGYDPKEQVVYLAIVVRDDSLITASKTAFGTDAIEIFVDGLRSETKMPNPQGKWEDVAKAEDMPVLQYVAIPDAKATPVYNWKDEENPTLMYGDIKKTKTKMAFSRKGDVTTYEWAIEAFDKYPDTKSKLEPGKRVGFDVVVVDRDVATDANGVTQNPADRPVWLGWGRVPTGFKGFNADLLGELVLGPVP